MKLHRDVALRKARNLLRGRMTQRDWENGAFQDDCIYMAKWIVLHCERDDLEHEACLDQQREEHGQEHFDESAS